MNKLLLELSYEGNVGVIELVKFFDKGTPQQIRDFKKAVDSHQEKRAWQIVQNTLGVKLQGKQFNESFQKIANDHVKYNGAEIEFEYYGQRAGSKKYRATLVNGKWPNDNDLITLADGSDPKNGPRHFGGKVSNFTDGRKEVVVWTD